VSLAPLTNGAMIFGAAGTTGYSGGLSVGGTAYVNHIIATNNAMFSGDSGLIYPQSLKTITTNANGYSGTNGVLLASIAPVATSLTARVYKSSSAQAVTANSFVGFANAGATVGQTINVVNGGKTANQTGLTIGAQYYLADTSGTLGTSAGTVTRKVGIAVSATEILITNIW
jgi:hypothetical protein